MAMCRPAGGFCAAVLAVIVLADLNGPSDSVAWPRNDKDIYNCPDVRIFSGNFESVIDGYNGSVELMVSACGRGQVVASQGAGDSAPLTERIITTWADGTPYSADEVAAFDRKSKARGELAPWDYYFDIQPCRLPGGSDLPGAGLTLKYSSQDPVASGAQTFTLAPDKQKPKLTTTSDPPKGTPVRPGQTIKVTMRASEHYRDAGENWQTGVKKIVLHDEIQNRDVSPHWENSESPQPCDRKQWEQTLTVTYTVPANAPPVVRLRAIAEDFAGNRDTDVGEFPLRPDWTGKLTWSMRAQTPGGSWTRFFGTADLTVNRDPQGALTGTIIGSVEMDGENRETPLCPKIRTATATKGQARLTGSHRPGSATMSLATADVQPIAMGQTTPCEGTPLPIASPDFAVMLHTNELQRRPDNSFHASGSTRSVQGGSTVTNEFSLTLNPASN